LLRPEPSGIIEALLTDGLLVPQPDGIFVSAATRSGLLFGLFAFFSSLGLGILFPLCTPLCGVVWGFGAGLATGAWSDPALADSQPARSGAIAGALAGIGSLLGLIIGVVLQFTVLGGQQTAAEISANLSNEFGYDLAPAEYQSTFQWIGVSFIGCCLGLANLAIMSLAGAGGTAVYTSRRGQEASNQAI
jgi:hypothetical protein